MSDSTHSEDSATLGAGGAQERPAAAFEGAPSPASSDLYTQGLSYEQWRARYEQTVTALAAAPSPKPLCEQVIRYNEGALQGDELRQFASHLSECPNCQEVVRLDRLAKEVRLG